jgi:hypothetical protein
MVEAVLFFSPNFFHTLVMPKYEKSCLVEKVSKADFLG